MPALLGLDRGLVALAADFSFHDAGFEFVAVFCES